jgi:hypothetical protein
MVDEASLVLKEALKKEDAEPDVARCLSEIVERQKKEGELFNQSMESATKQKEFLVALGKGLQEKEAPRLEGIWRMPFGEIQLRTVGGTLEGQTEVIQETSRNALFYGALSALGGTGGIGTARNKPEQVRIYSISGPVTGSVCCFTINMRPKDASAGILGFVGAEESTHGYIVFSPDGRSARYAKLKDGNLSGFSLLERTGAKIA